MSASRVVHPVVEVLIIGGGPGGLATALSLARARRQVILFDSGKYRNQHVSHMHNVITWDHRSPAEFRDVARRELTQGRYSTVQIKDIAISEVKKNADGIFEATDAAGETWQGKTLVIGTGVTDTLPDLPGYRECWESSKIHHCLWCHGYEDSDCESAGVIAAFGFTSAAPPAAHASQLAAQFAGKVVVYTNGSVELAQQIQEIVKKNPRISTDSRPIEALIKDANDHGEPGIKLRQSADGSSPAEVIPHRFFVHVPDSSPNIGFAKPLGLELSDAGSDIKTTPPFNATNVPGCFAVGDVGSPVKVVALAISAGNLTAAGVTGDLF